MPLRLDSADRGFEAAFAELLDSKREAAADVDAAVAAILAEVRKRGDAALIDYTRRFDRLDLTPATLRIPESELEAAADACDAETIAALELAAARISDYHRRQTPEDLDYRDSVGVRLGHRWTAGATAGLLVPGGTRADRERAAQGKRV